MATPTKELKQPGGGYDLREVKTVHDLPDADVAVVLELPSSAQNLRTI